VAPAVRATEALWDYPVMLERNGVRPVLVTQPAVEELTAAVVEGVEGSTPVPSRQRAA
jgi:hypothetical protein